MPIIISSADLRNQYAEVSKKCHETNEPIFVTKNGKGDIAILSIESYDRLISVASARSKILQGVEEAEDGNLLPEEAVLLEARSKSGKAL